MITTKINLLLPLYISVIFFTISFYGQAQHISEYSSTLLAEEWADHTMRSMTIDEKIGQLFMIAAYSNRDSTHTNEITNLIKQYHVGGLIFFQGTPVAQTKLLNQYQSQSKLPLWVAMDAEWGVGMRLDSTMSFPYQMTLGAIRNNELIYEMGQAIGKQFRRLGMHMNYAPVLDVNNNAANPVINFRSFGENKYNVAEKGLAYIHGLQDAGVLATGKHFPGHGDTEVDSHKDLPVITQSWDRLESLELYPFKAAMQKGLEGVMVAHLNIPSLDDTEHLPSTLSRKIVKGLLRDSLGFNGLVFTDALQMQGITKYYKPGEIETMALQADNDVLLFPADMPEAVRWIKEAIRTGNLGKSLIDEKCRKILVAKYLLDVSNTSIPTKNLYKDINSLPDQLLNRKLHRSAITVIKNSNQLLPLKHLDTLKIASLHIGFGKQNIYEERLSKYTDVDHYVVSIEDLSNRGSSLLDSLKNYNLVLAGVDNLSKWPSKNYGVTEELDGFLGELLSNNQTILTWWGSPYGLSNISDFDLAQAIIITYQENDLMNDYAAQVIFGGLKANGKLPVSINSKYPEGTGFDLYDRIRFSYLLPEEAGLDGTYLTTKIDSIAKMAVSEGVAPGLQVLVARDQKIVYHKTFGYHTYDSLMEVKSNDIYDLASVTKVTGALPALMRLHGQNRFDLDATLGDYIEEFKKGNKKDIQIRKILSHNARLKAWIPYWTTTIRNNGKYKRKTLSPEYSADYSTKLTDQLYLHKDYKKKIYKMIRKSELLPEEGYVYSGLSFYLWPEVVSDIVNDDFEHYLKNIFYKPLGATTITYNPYKYYSLDRIIPTEVDTFFRKVPIHGHVHDEGAAMMDGVSSNAGLFASTNDLAKLFQMYLNMGTYGGEQYISRNSLQNFTFCHYCEEGNRRGLAFDKPVLENKENGSTALEASANSFGHSGYTGTFAWADPDTGILFIFMSNRVFPTRDNRKLYQLNIRPLMHQVVYDARIE